MNFNIGNGSLRSFKDAHLEAYRIISNVRFYGRNVKKKIAVVHIARADRILVNLQTLLYKYLVVDVALLHAE